MNTPTLEELASVAHSTAQLAVEMIRSHRFDTVTVNESHHHDIKIQLDVDVQQAMEAHILKHFPDHHILGEEGGSGNEGVGYEWILDPIDGTVNFTYGIPHYCTSIACRHHGKTQVGIVWDVPRDECFKAILGKGAWCNDRPLKVTPRKEIEEAIMAVGFAKSADSIEKCLELYNYYGRKARKLRAMGAAALDLAYVSAGRLDVYLEQGVKTWDIAAGILLVEEAGGKVEATLIAEPHHYHVCAWNGLLDLPKR